MATQRLGRVDVVEVRQATHALAAPELWFQKQPLRVQGLGFRVYSRVEGLGLRVEGLGFRVKDLGFLGFRVLQGKCLTSKLFNSSTFEALQAHGPQLTSSVA